MYRNCIFCSADLGTNDSIEEFPVGRSVAFDAARGRLWAVCRRCARWNLAPIEERWEAIEQGDRLFRDSRLRVQSENVGLARLRDGTRLIRIGQALDGELAAWRYGREMRRRRMRMGAERLATFVASNLWPLLSITVAALPGLGFLPPSLPQYLGARSADRPMHQIPAAHSPTGLPLTLRWRDLSLVNTSWSAEAGLLLQVVQTRELWAGSSPVVLTGPAAAAVLGKALVRINGAGASRRTLDFALSRMSLAGGPETFLREVAAPGHSLPVPGLTYEASVGRSSLQLLARAREANTPRSEPLGWDPVGALGAEMALHHETERRALEGELSMLEAMWRDAEQIAAIADRLPDGVPATDPPHLTPG